MNIWHSFAGMLLVELTCADPAATLEILNRNNILLSDVHLQDELTVVFRIFRKDYPRLRRICERKGDTVVVRGQIGLWWTGRSLLSRPFLLVGFLVLLTAVLIIPSKVLFVRVEGNLEIPSARILDAAQSCGIRFGASRREVRSERVKNALLSEIPELQWAGVNTAGCVAVISVRERDFTETEEEIPKVSSIVAARDGVIESTTVINGFGMCLPGQVVQEGQMLISGYTDCGIRIIATRAEGEIFARTTRNLLVVTPSVCEKRAPKNGIARKISLLIGKKRINLWKDSGIWDTTCGRMYAEYYITLPGDFQLPLALSVETYVLGNTYEEPVSEAEAQHALTDFARKHLSENMVAGTILEEAAVFRQADGVYLLNAEFICREMIGRERQEKIGENYGKNS